MHLLLREHPIGQCPLIRQQTITAVVPLGTLIYRRRKGDVVAGREENQGWADIGRGYRELVVRSSITKIWLSFNAYEEEKSHALEVGAVYDSKRGFQKAALMNGKLAWLQKTRSRRCPVVGKVVGSDLAWAPRLRGEEE